MKTCGCLFSPGLNMRKRHQIDVRMELWGDIERHVHHLENVVPIHREIQDFESLGVGCEAGLVQARFQESHIIMSERSHGNRIAEHSNSSRVGRFLIAIFWIRHSQTVGDPHSGWIRPSDIRPELVTPKIVTESYIVPLRGHAKMDGILLKPFVIAGGQQVKVLTIQVAILHLREQLLQTETVLAMRHQGWKQVQTKKAQEEYERNEEILREVVARLVHA